MNYDQIVQLISSVGFPIVVTGYCLLTINKTMEQLADNINKLIEKVGEIKDD